MKFENWIVRDVYFVVMKSQGLKLGSKRDVESQTNLVSTVFIMIMGNLSLEKLSKT